MPKSTPVPVPVSPEWWRTAVIYQVYPRSFADASGDGIGDLPGITSRLGHLADLGVDAVWLSPFYVSPQNDAGYDVADYCDVDPLFGTLDDADALIARAHELGLRVIERAEQGIDVAVVRHVVSGVVLRGYVERG